MMINKIKKKRRIKNKKFNRNANSKKSPTHQRVLANFISHHPYLTLIITMGITLILTIISAVKPFKIDATEENLRVKSGEVVDKIDAVGMSYEHTFFDPAKNEIENQPHAQNTQSQMKVVFYYECSGCDNLLTESKLKRIYKFEKDIFQHKNYNDYCLKEENQTECALQSTIINNYFDSYGNLKPNIQEISQEIANSTQEAALYFDKNFNEGNLKTKYIRSIYTFGLPLKGYYNRRDRTDQQEDKFNDWIIGIVPDQAKDCETDSLKIYYLGSGLTQYMVDQMIIKDGLLIFASIVLVFLYTWFHTKSLYLTSLGIFHVLMSFPLSYFVYRIIVGEEFFSMLNFISLFIVLGIGCDDIFIMLDAWKQSSCQSYEISKNIHTKLRWSYSRASVAMAITTITTTGAFFGNLFSPIPAIKYFGLFTGVSVVLNYLLVVTWFPANIIIWDSFGGGQCCCKSKKFKLARKQTLEQTLKQEEIEKINADLNVNVNLNLKDEKDSNFKIEKDLNEITIDLNETNKKTNEEKKGKGKEEEELSKNEYDIDIKQFRLLERFFYNKYSPFIKKYKIFLIILFLIMMGLGIFGTTHLQPASEPAQFLKKNNPIRRPFDIQNSYFQMADVPYGYHIGWGISGLDRSTVDPMDTENLGEVIYDGDWNPTTEEAQLYFIDVCQKVRNLSVIKDHQIFCFMEDFRDYINNLTLSGEYNGFPVNSSIFNTALLSYAQYYGDDTVDAESFKVRSYYQAGIRFDEKTSRLLYFAIIANLTLGDRDPAKKTRPYFDDLQDFVQKINDNAPTGMSGAFSACDIWIRMLTEESLITVALYNMITSFCIAAVVIMISTDNIITSFFSLFSILGIVLCVIGVIVAIGWELGIIESVTLTIIVGVSIDYVVHFAHAYTHRNLPTRYLKVRYAMTDLGISVFSAAVTTLGAAFVLFFTIILFFRNFGIILWLVILFSVLWSFVFFFSILTLIGPETKKTNFTYILGKCFSFFKCRKKNQNENQNEFEEQKTKLLQKNNI
ncbi:hypothetical protein M0811_00367 [Anaeramoeba ignava]|uniref:SSD domain-containing protein n=1 Tax=Anaeramoeba ignava TaxID=1746090 RepID=A0A9Q0LQD2_ANAIG|nr:hypothetical protein M0811_00367 [Anaeramoeba ignava]